MDSTAQPQFSLASRGPAARVGLFVAVMLVMSAVAAPLGFAISGRDGIGCVILAAGVCTIAGVAEASQRTGAAAGDMAEAVNEMLSEQTHLRQSVETFLAKVQAR